MGYIDASKLFQPGAQPTIEVEAATVTLTWENGESMDPLAPIKRVVIHWTAGPYLMAFNSYHYVAVWDAAAKQAHVVQCLQLGQLGQHTYRFNTGSVGIALACMGPGCPTVPELLDAGARFTAEFMAWHQLDPHQLGANSEAQLIDHATVNEFIDQGGKIDIRDVWSEFVAKVQAYHAQLKAGTIQWRYEEIIK